MSFLDVFKSDSKMEFEPVAIGSSTSTSAEHKKLLKKRMGETGNSYLSEFLKFINIWNDFPKDMHKLWRHEYQELIDFITDREQVVITGSSTLEMYIKERHNSEFSMDVGDIDLFYRHDDLEQSMGKNERDKAKRETQTQLKNIFRSALLNAMYKTYFNKYLVDYVTDRKLKKKLLKELPEHSDIFSTTSSDYNTMSDVKGEIFETFQLKIGEVFALNFIGVGKNKTKEKYFDDSYNNLKHIRFVDETFDFENNKFIYDFKNKCTVHSQDFLFDSYMDVETSLIGAESGCVRNTQSRIGYLKRQRADAIDNESSKYNLVHKYPMNLYSTGYLDGLTRELENLIMSIHHNLRMARDGRDDFDIGKISYSNETVEYLILTMKRILKYTKRGFEYHDTEGLFILMKELKKIQFNIIDSIPEFKKIAAKSILIHKTSATRTIKDCGSEAVAELLRDLKEQEKIKKTQMKVEEEKHAEETRCD